MLISSRRRSRLQFKLKKAQSLFSLLILLSALGFLKTLDSDRPQPAPSPLARNFPPLALEDGDPHIRALMLTISASESNHAYAYALLYGGRHIHHFQEHPNRCLPIRVGPNRGRCSTAAGRYQFLTATWQEKAARYHPHPQRTPQGITYSFEPKYQDLVVYRWLTDSRQWERDLLTQLQGGRVEAVLDQLSPIWTSLGNGLEDNTQTPHLPALYRYFLAQEKGRRS